MFFAIQAFLIANIALKHLRFFLSSFYVNIPYQNICGNIAFLIANIALKHLKFFL